MTVIFRCRASSQVGMGHLVRCRVLAAALKDRGIRSVMTGPSERFRVAEDDNLFANWVVREDWGEAVIEADFITDVAQQYSSKHLIIDDYRSDGFHQKVLRDRGFRTLQQYDASQPQRFASPLVINSSPAECRETYEKDLLVSPVRMLHGPLYAILRPAFKNVEIRPHAPVCKRILISFGGGDDRGAVLKTLKALGTGWSDDVSFQIMVGKTNPNQDSIQDWIDKNPGCPATLNVNPPNVPALIASCDLAVMSGGTSTFEAAYCGVPMILAPIVPNQHAQGEGWADLGAAISLGPMKELESEILRQTIADLMIASDRRKRMRNVGRRAVDGYGVTRILDILMEDETR